MVLNNLLGSKTEKNQAHISLSKSKYSHSPYASYKRNGASKISLGICENPILVRYHWCNGALYDSSCHSAFSVDKGINVCKGWHLYPASWCLHCCCVRLPETLSVLLHLHETVCELLQEEITSLISQAILYMAFCSGVINGIFHQFSWEIFLWP